MNDVALSDSSHSQRWNEVLADYLVRIDCGEAVDRERFIREHPEFARELEEHFEASRVLARVALADTTDPADIPRTPDGDAICSLPSPAFVPREVGGYELRKVVASGGMGTVYLARQRDLRRDVAVKMIRGDRLSLEGEVERFFVEARAAARLQHPNIVAIHEIGEHEGQPYFSMDYVPGQSLAQRLEENPLPVRDAAACLRKIALAVHYAHTQGVVHRDLKPSNVLIDEHGEPWVTDFGLARQIADDNRLTATGAVLGTACYMSPEQAQGISAVGPTSDVYSLGSIFYEMLVGHPPFNARGWYQISILLMHCDPVSPRLLNGAIPIDLATICMKCLEKDPARRYPTALVLAEELQRYLQGRPILARPAGVVERTWRWCRRNPWLAALGTATALCAVAAFAAVLTGYVRVSAAEARATHNLVAARDAVHDLFDIAAEKLKNQPGAQPARRELLEKAGSYYQAFLDANGRDSTLRDELARTHYNRAVICDELGQFEQAGEEFDRAIELQREQCKAAPDRPAALAACATWINRRGAFRQQHGNLEEAFADFNEAREIRLRLGDRLGAANTLLNLAVNRKDQVKLAPAGPSANSLWQESLRKLSDARSILAGLYETSGSDPSRYDVRRAQAKCEYLLALHHLARPEALASERPAGGSVPPQAVAHADAAVELFRELVALKPGDLELANLRLTSEQQARALNCPHAPSYDWLCQEWRKMVRKNPSVPHYAVELMQVLVSSAVQQRQDPGRQRLLLEEARKVGESIDPDNLPKTDRKLWERMRALLNKPQPQSDSPRLSAR